MAPRFASALGMQRGVALTNQSIAFNFESWCAMRKTVCLFTAAATLTLATPLFAAAIANAEPCAGTIDVAVDGTGAVNHPNSIPSIHAPNAVHVQYPGSIWPLGPYTYDQSVAAGVAETKRVVREQHSRCPQSTVRVIGHSQGSRVAGDAIEQLAAEGDVSFIDAELYSDPRHRGKGIEVMVPLGLPGNRFMGERGSFGAADVEQVCVAGDPICSWPDLTREPLKVFDIVPGYTNLHGAYPVGVVNEVDVPAAPAPVVLLPELPPLPPLPNLVEPYVARPLSVYVPVEVQGFVPRGVLDWTPPPLPPLPVIPPLF